MTYDCIIVGGGPAGLSAALVLGRARRRVLVLDAGTPRNHRSAGMHGFLTRDGIDPAEFLRIGREQLAAYDSVELRDGIVADAAAAAGGFAVQLEGGEALKGRTLLLSTGVVDDIPPLEGLDPFYGHSVHHCPYCDGWEHRDEPLVVYGCGDIGARYALGMTVWSRDIVLCTDGPYAIDDDLRRQLDEQAIAIRIEKVLRLEGAGDRIERVVLAEGPAVPCTALFFCGTQHQRSALPAKLGCRFTEAGAVATGPAESTNVPGVFVAGDASRDAQLVVVAVAEGAEAAIAINVLLARQDLDAGVRRRVH